MHVGLAKDGKLAKSKAMVDLIQWIIQKFK